jgi:hypothetical protein
VSAALLTPALTNGTTARINASCFGESSPSECMTCASVTVNGIENSRSCSSTTTLAVGMAVDGAYEARVSAVDSAGNEAPVTLLSWSRDAAAPNTSASVNTALTPLFDVPLLAIAATNVSTLVFTAASSEASGGLSVSLDGVAVGAGLLSGPSVAVNVSLDGVHTVTIAAVDATGNADATPVEVRVLVDRATPSTAVAVQPAAVSNASTALLAWRASGEVAGCHGFSCRLPPRSRCCRRS